jgi:hypothetical protein
MSVMKRLQKYIKNKKNVTKKPIKLKTETKPVKRKGQAKVSKLRSRYDPSTDQWIKYTD